MELQSIWNVAGTAAIGVLGWFARAMYAAIRALETDLAAHKVEVARDYVTNTDLKEIKEALIRIEAVIRK